VKTYRLLRDCRKGEVVDIGDSGTFEIVPGKDDPVHIPEEGIALSQIHNRPKVTHGFAYCCEDAQPKTPKTSGLNKEGEGPTGPSLSS
jgi:hypothetical protein